MDSDLVDETVTPADVLRILEQCWLNEKLSPDILPAQSDILECMIEQLEQMEKNIRLAKKGDFKVHIHQLEVDRIRFVVASYLRTRLQKIEAYASHIEEEYKSRLTQEECLFVSEYVASIQEQLSTVALNHMPDKFQTLDTKLSARKPNIDKYVYIRVKKNVGSVILNDSSNSGGEIIKLEAGDQHLLPYRSIRQLLSSDDVVLM